jgi:hypothetical protein
MIATLIAYAVATILALICLFGVCLTPFEKTSEQPECFWGGVIFLALAYLAASLGGI